MTATDTPDARRARQAEPAARPAFDWRAWSSVLVSTILGWMVLYMGPFGLVLLVVPEQLALVRQYGFFVHPKPWGVIFVAEALLAFLTLWRPDLVAFRRAVLVALLSIWTGWVVLLVALSFSRGYTWVSALYGTAGVLLSLIAMAAAYPTSTPPSPRVLARRLHTWTGARAASLSGALKGVRGGAR